MMSKIKIAGAAGALGLAGLSTALVLQNQAHTRLAEENSSLRAAAAQVEGLREENARLAKLELDAAELARLRQEQNELLRLRGELTRLRKQLGQTNRPSVQPPDSPPTAPETSSPVDTFSTALSANVPPGQTLLAGGWKTGEGKRTFMLLTPNLATENPGGNTPQVMVQAVLVKVPENLLSQLGWNQFQAEGSDSQQSSLLTTVQFREVLEVLRQTEGVEIVSSPRVHSLDGMQAKVSVGSHQTIGGENIFLGPTIDLTPNVASDGSGINLSIHARINQLREQ